VKLGEVLYKWRRMEDLSLREVAPMLGISVATLSRVESGESMDGKTLAKILAWLMKEHP